MHNDQSPGEMSLSRKTALAVACMKVAHNKERNLQTYLKFIKQAAKKKCDFLAFPECSLQGYTWTWDPVRYKYYEDSSQRKYFEENAEPVPGPSTDFLCEEAAKNSMYIQFGLAEKPDHSSRRIFNSAVLVGPEGLVGKFRKVHMSSSPIFSRGDSFKVFTTGLGKVGMIVCADLQYPESMRTLALQGAEVVVNSTAWGMRRKTPRGDYSGYRYDILGRANAMMNQVWLLQSAQIGRATNSNEYCYGHSCIIDPAGLVVSDTGYRVGLAAASVNIREGIKRAQSHKFAGHNILRSRRPEAYRS